MANDLLANVLRVARNCERVVDSAELVCENCVEDEIPELEYEEIPVLFPTGQ